MAPGAMKQWASIKQPQSILAPVFTTELSPIDVSGIVIEPAINCTPAPSDAQEDWRALKSTQDLRCRIALSIGILSATANRSELVGDRGRDRALDGGGNRRAVQHRFRGKVAQLMGADVDGRHGEQRRLDNAA